VPVPDSEAPLRSKSLIDRPCPMCHTPSQVEDVRVKAPIGAASITDDERAAYWRGFRSKSCFFDFAKCAKCGMIFCPTYLAESELDRLYSSMPDNTAGAAPDVLRGTQEGYIDFLASQRDIRGTYLEIGPDIGLAVEAARAKGSLDRTVLVEPNLAVHDQLRAASGTVPTTISASLDDLPQCAAADNVVLIHVLDHLVDPLGYLVDLRRQLVPGAHLLAVVHNYDSVLRRVLGVRWPPFCLQHPQLFAADTLSALLVDAGFQVVSTSPTRNSLPFRHMVETGLALVGLKGGWTRHIPDVVVRIRLGNIMVVAAS
jgi:SAM-dependent methyltransferase